VHAAALPRFSREGWHEPECVVSIDLDATGLGIAASLLLRPCGQREADGISLARRPLSPRRLDAAAPGARSPMNATRLAFHDVVLLEPKVFSDARGVFFESYNQKSFEAATGLSQGFVQDNHSVSAKGVVRGLHYQLPPFAQGKLVRVVVGAILDVVVDIRRGSPHFGDWIGVELSAQNRRQLWVPEGFAHGFLALEAASEVLYKATSYYVPGSERCILWNDPDIGIGWGEAHPIVSDKDKVGIPLKAAEVFEASAASGRSATDIA
jgi:dTDP-4-dehydrorhamnose 3,5-epimerase